MASSVIPIEVVTRTKEDGVVQPIKFTWKDRVYPILGVGRRWQTDQGEHILVMVAGEQVIELLHRLDGNWALKPSPKQSKRWFV